MLRIRHLSVHFGPKAAIDDLSLDLGPGRVLGIVGESGSGKSMTALAVMGLLPAGARATGQILFGEPDPAPLLGLGAKAYARLRGSRLAMVFQDPLSALNPSLTIGRQITEAILAHRPMPSAEARSEALEWLGRARLPEPERIYASYPFQVSGGQRQRALIAMALCNRPQLVIADEPTTALDVTAQREIVELLSAMARDGGASLIFISHDLALVTQIADEILVMYRGKTMEHGPARQVALEPRHPYTRALLQCKPTMETPRGRLPEVDEIMAGETRTVDNEPISTRNPAQEESPKPGAPILTAQDVEVTYGGGRRRRGTRAVAGVSFELFEGETFGLAGESGCGKSTLSRALLDLVRATGGEIRLDGQPLRFWSRDRLRLSREVQMVFQDPYSSLNPSMEVGEAVREAVALHHRGMTRRDARDAAARWLADVGLDESFYHRRPSELSGGQRQRVVIARALAPEPRVVICDEPVSALDVSVQAKVLNLLNDLKKRHNLTYLFISHDLAVVKYMSDRLAVMQRGRFVETGDPARIFAHPNDPYTRRLIDSIPRVAGR